MKFKDYKCLRCGEVTEITFKDTDIMPENSSCPVCGYTSEKIITPVSSIIHQGKAGNYKNGYTSSPVSIKKS